MSSIIITPEAVATLEATIDASASLESMLVALCRVGRPACSRLTSGWWCRVEMHVAAAGTQFQVASESDCETPSLAAKQCIERVLATLKQWIGK